MILPQVDSHTHFKPRWDVRLIADWRRTRDEHAVLTTYPLALDHEKDAEEYEPPPAPPPFAAHQSFVARTFLIASCCLCLAQLRRYELVPRICGYEWRDALPFNLQVRARPPPRCVSASKPRVAASDGKLPKLRKLPARKLPNARMCRRSTRRSVRRRCVRCSGERG
jgi:hypothetical protein